MQVEPLGQRERVHADDLRLLVAAQPASTRAWMASTLARSPLAPSGTSASASPDSSSRVLVGSR